MSQHINYWFADVDPDQEDCTFVWQPVLQMAGHQTACTIWFSSPEDCMDFIRDEIPGALIGSPKTRSASLSSTESEQT